MSDDRKGIMLSASEGGISGEHAAAEPFVIRVGPTTTDQFNTARLRLIPIACFRVDDIRFAFDSSFVVSIATSDPNDTTDNLAELRDLARLVKDHPGSPLSVFGHADPVGNDDYNKLLSGRRAKAIYALLIVNGEPDSAVNLWRQISATEHWGVDQRQTMQEFTGLPSGTPNSTLFRSYMQKLCPPDLKLTKKDFLGQGADYGGKGDFQGCGEFNPVILFSREKEERFRQGQEQDDKDVIEKRNADNAPNRRVMVLMFRKGSRVDPAKWPCPRATEGVGGCIKRFFSDGEKRRSTHLPATDRKFDATKDTFACRFYQRISDESPCDRILKRIQVHLYDGFGISIPFAPFRVAIGDSETFSDLHKADRGGVITISLSSPTGDPSSLTLEWGFVPKQGEEPVLLFKRTMFLISPDEPREEAAIKKLSNLGYDSDDKIQNITGFQLDYGPLVNPFLDITGELDDPTLNLLERIYQQSARDLRQTNTSEGQGT